MYNMIITFGIDWVKTISSSFSIKLNSSTVSSTIRELAWDFFRSLNKLIDFSLSSHEIDSFSTSMQNSYKTSNQ